jgi:hypothetical protein
MAIGWKLLKNGLIGTAWENCHQELRLLKKQNLHEFITKFPV